MASAFTALGHEVVSVEVNDDLKQWLLKVKPQLAFKRLTRMDAGSDVDPTLSLLDKLGIPHIGSSAGVCINAYNKHKSKCLFDKARIPTPGYCLVSDPADIHIPPSLQFPLFVKPIMGGCSRGIDDRNPASSQEACTGLIRTTIERNRQPALVEEFKTGREFTVGILGNDPPRVLPILEVIQTPSAGREYPFRSFKTKTVEKKNERKSCPAALSDVEKDRIRDIGLRVFNLIGCRDYARVDIRCDKEGNPFILEVNALPSLTPGSSSFTAMAEAAGISFQNLVQEIIASAMKRYAVDLSR